VVTAANWKNYNIVEKIYQFFSDVAYSKVLDMYKLHIQEHNNNNDDDDDDKNNYNSYNNSKKLLRLQLLAYSGFVNRNLASLSSAMLLVLLEVNLRIPYFPFSLVIDFESLLNLVYGPSSILRKRISAMSLFVLCSFVK
jgi:hypothetical protein